MQSTSFTIATMWVDDVELPLLDADLVVVRREERTDLDWECIATTTPIAPLPLAPVRLVMDDLLSGRQFLGTAVVVRSDEQRHVFRGGGDLDGVTRADDLEP